MDKILEKYAKIPPAQRYLIALVLVLLLIAAHYYMIYTEQISDHEKIEQEYQTALQQADQKRSVADNLEVYEARLAKLQKELDKAKALLPDSADVPQLLAQLGNVGRKTGLDIQEFAPKGERIDTTKKCEVNFYAEIDFSMKVVGSYHDIALFIDAVGHLDRVINVSNISMKEPRTIDEKIFVKGDFGVKTYRFVGDDERKKLQAACKNKGKKKRKR